MRDKRILPAERDNAGACVTCNRRHIHTDDCATLKHREVVPPPSLWRDEERDAASVADWNRKYFRGDH